MALCSCHLHLCWRPFISESFDLVDELIMSDYREVIERRPEEFKMAALKDVRALFPSTVNPFYSGFGNRVTVRERKSARFNNKKLFRTRSPIVRSI